MGNEFQFVVCSIWGFLCRSLFEYEIMSRTEASFSVVEGSCQCSE